MMTWWPRPNPNLHAKQVILNHQDNSSMATQTMYAFGLICGIVCPECKNKPCPYKSWVKKNTCTKIIAYNEKIGQCCATCMHLVAEKYCGEKARMMKYKANTDFSQFLIKDDIFKHSCKLWTNTYEEEV